MPKLKTHKAMSKKLHVKQSGVISIGKAGGNHKTGKNASKISRRLRKGSLLSKSDSKRLKTVVFR
jgi:large subunit ribosomal protein L35